MMKQQRSDEARDDRLEAWLAGAPPAPPSPGFETRVMQAVRDHARHRERGGPAWLRRLLGFLLAPRTLQFNVGGLALAGVAAMAAGLAITAWRAEAPVPPLAMGDETLTVRFVLVQPEAREVRLAADFTGWQPDVPLRRDGQGHWVAEVRLRPGSYEYSFVVDGGRWVEDPRGTLFREDGFGRRNSVLTVTDHPSAGDKGNG